MTCPHCAGKGLIRVAYESGEPFDLALCVCPKGQYFRRSEDAFVAQAFGVDLGVHRIGLFEHFADDPTPVPPTSEAFLEAGRMRKRAKL